MRRLTFSLLMTFAILLALPLHAADRPADIIQEILARGEAAIAAYDETSPLPTATEISSIYFSRFEELELKLSLLDTQLKNELEVLFGAVNGSAMRGVPRAQLNDRWQQLASKLQIAQALFIESEGQTEASQVVFFKSLIILLREGTEAMLVIAALISWLRRAGAADKTWVIYAGTGVAVLASIITGLAIERLLKNIGAPLAVVEGITMLAASVMLFSVSCWLFAKRSAKRWEQWISDQMENAMSKGSLLALSSTAFLAVYREGAETVLFYQALSSSAPNQGEAILAGFLLATLILVVLYLILRQAALRLPFGLFFGATSMLLYLLAIVFLGQGIVELQAAGWIGSIYLPGIPHISWLGIAPSAQSLGVQALLLTLPCLWLVRQRLRRSSYASQRPPSTPR